MAKYTGPDCRLCRREGEKLYLKGDRCYNISNEGTTKKLCPLDKGRTAPPGPVRPGRRKISGYALQLREKQKTKRAYGLLEKQFYHYYVKAERMKGITGENMLILIERRLDNIVFRLGLGASRAQARQIVNHGHITVNGLGVDIPSYLVSMGDVIAVKESKASNKLFEAVKEVGSKSVIPKWLELDKTTLTGKVLQLPLREDIDSRIKEHMIVELYSK
ncbi:MAG: 30S ribosomal protein S4 [Clostridia bacterium]|nr:30S ribosomal protein S4 [Clostridia bacterium]